MRFIRNIWLVAQKLRLQATVLMKALVARVRRWRSMLPW